MKRFSFDLQKILDLREFEENQAKEELARVIAIENAIHLELEYIASERVRTKKSINDIFDVASMQSSELYVQRLDLRKEELLRQLAQTQLIIEQKRGLFAEAMKNRKVISKLKEKKYQEWRKDMIKAEEAVLDESAGAKGNRASLKT